MRNILSLVALGAIALSANLFSQSCPTCNSGGNYQGQSYGGGYQGGYQNQPSYSQGGNFEQQGWRRVDGPQGSQRVQQSQQQTYQQNDQYQQQGNRPYGAPRSNVDQYQHDDNRPYGSSQYNKDENYDYQKPADQNKSVLSDEDKKLSPDQRLNKKVHDTLTGGWFSKGFQDVSYDVNGGHVTLRGTVDSQENKDQVDNSIKKIDGVTGVTNEITVVKAGSKGYTDEQLLNSEKKYPRDTATGTDDRQLNARIRDKLSLGWFSKNSETVVIRTANGTVIITGTVEKPEDVQKVTDQVKAIEGVNNVNNQLQVKPK